MAVVINPLFFDFFGFVIWVFVTWIAVKDLKNAFLDKWPKIILLAIGIAGIVLDGTLLALFLLGRGVSYAGLFDILGIPIFLFIIWLSWKDLKNISIMRPGWTKHLLLAIGIAGLLADGYIVVQNYMLG